MYNEKDNFYDIGADACGCSAGRMSGNGGSSSSDGNNGQSSSSQPVKEVSVDEVLTAIKEAYGDDFLADRNPCRNDGNRIPCSF